MNKEHDFIVENSTLPIFSLNNLNNIIPGVKTSALTMLVSGYGQFHSPYNKKSPKDYITISIKDIISMLKHPQAIDKAQAQWFIPSTLLSRVHKEQRDNGKFYSLWADIDDIKDVKFAEIVEFFQSFILPDTEAILYTTASATPDKQKSRIIIPLLEPVDGITFIILQTILNDKLQAIGILPDRATQRTGQVCYLPNKGIISENRPELFYQHEILSGKTFNHSVWEQDIKTYQERLKIQAQEQQTRQIRAKQQVQHRIDSGQLNPVEAYKDAYPVETALEMYGYIRHGDKWLSPLSLSGIPALSIKDGKAYSHHSSDADIPKSSQGCFDAFDLFTYFECGNNFNEAVRRAGEMFTINGKTINKHNQIEYMQGQEQSFNHTESFDSHIPANTTKYPEIDFMTFYEIYSENKQIEWFIKDFLPKGETTLITSIGGTGKSMFTVYLAYLLSMEAKNREEKIGIKLFEQFEFIQTKPVNSLFLQTENSNAQINSRIRFIAGTNTEPLKHIYTPVFNHSCMTQGITFLDKSDSPKQFQTWFYALINKIEDKTKQKIDIVWVDPLISFSNANENDNVEMRKVIDAFKDTALSINTTPVIIHHNAKDGTISRGASSILDAARNVISMKSIKVADTYKKTSLQGVEISHEKTNNSKKFQTFKAVMQDNFTFSTANNSLSPDEFKNIEFIKQALTDLGGKANTQKQLIKQYMELSGCSPNTAQKYINKAIEYGYIFREQDDIQQNGYSYSL